MRIGKALVAALALSLASAAFAVPTLSVGTVSGAPGNSVSVPVNFTNDAGITALQFDVEFDTAKISAIGAPTEGAALSGTDHDVDSNLVSAGRFRVLVLSDSLAVIPGGVLVNLPITIAAGATAPTTATLNLTGVELVEATAQVVVGTSGNGLINITTGACAVPGNILESAPPNNGRVNVADVVYARRKTLPGAVPPTDDEMKCGNLAPGFEQACSPVAGKKSWCHTTEVSPDFPRINVADVVAIRRISVASHVYSCVACAGQAAAGGLRVPGDITPRGTGDGRLDIADVVLALRYSVGLDTPGTDGPIADLAPARRDGAATVADGNGRVDVADVVLMLRAAVGLEQVSWATRNIDVVMPVGTPRVGFSVRVAGWPMHSEVVGSSAAECSGETSGLDIASGAWGLTCITDPQVVSTSGVIGTVQYRGPRVDLTTLPVESDAVDAALQVTSGVIQLQAR